jgi:hypothetical protein
MISLSPPERKPAGFAGQDAAKFMKIRLRAAGLPNPGRFFFDEPTASVLPGSQEACQSDTWPAGNDMSLIALAIFLSAGLTPTRRVWRFTRGKIIECKCAHAQCP